MASFSSHLPRTRSPPRTLGPTRGDESPRLFRPNVLALMGMAPMAPPGRKGQATRSVRDNVVGHLPPPLLPASGGTESTATMTTVGPGAPRSPGHHDGHQRLQRWRWGGRPASRAVHRRRHPGRSQGTSPPLDTTARRPSSATSIKGLRGVDAARTMTMLHPPGGSAAPRARWKVTTRTT